MDPADPIAQLDDELASAPEDVREAWVTVRAHLRKQRRGAKESTPLSMMTAAVAARERAEAAAERNARLADRISGPVDEDR